MSPQSIFFFDGVTTATSSSSAASIAFTIATAAATTSSTTIWSARSTMPEKSLWHHLNVALPELNYTNYQTSGQGKGSTTWAAYSRTPMKVGFWTEFDSLIDSESKQTRSKEVIDAQFSKQLEDLAGRRSFAKEVKEEEDVTDRCVLVLDEFSERFSGGADFCKSSRNVLANPDIIVEIRNAQVWGSGKAADYESPINRAAKRREVVAAYQELFVFPFETKPFWKFHFLMGRSSHNKLINHWEVPEDFDLLKFHA